MGTFKFLLGLATFVFLFHNSALAEAYDINTNKTFSLAYKRAEKMYADNNPIAAAKLYWSLYESDEQGRALVLSQLSAQYRKSNRVSDFINILEEKLNKKPFEYSLNKQLAAEYFFTGETEKALEKIKIALADSKVENQALSLASEINLRAKKFEDCVYYSSRALQEKHSTEVLLLRTECFINLKNAKNSQADLNNYLKEEPSTQKTYNLQNSIFELSGESKKAENNLQLCLAQIPNSEDCFAGYLKKFGIRNNVWSSQHFETNLNYFMKSPVVLTEMAQIYSLYPRPPTEEVLLKLIELNPANYTYHKQLVDFYKKTKQPQKAYDLLQRYLALNPKSIEANDEIKSLFSIQAQQKNPLNEVAATKSVVNQESLLSVTKSKAQQLYESAAYEQALNIVRNTKPRGSKEYFRVANIMYLLKNYRLARTNWSYVSKQSPLYENAKLNTAIAFAIQGMNSEAVKVLKANDFSADYKSKVDKLMSLLPGQQNLSEAELKELRTQYENLINLEWGAQ